MRAIIRPCAILVTGWILCVSTLQPSLAQTSMPEVMDTARLGEQLDYIQEHTRIYNDYRAIREDIFQRVKRNTMDSIARARGEIAGLNEALERSGREVETLQADLQNVKEERDRAIRNRDSLSFLGIQMNKTIYNMIMWVIVAGLAALAVILFLLFKRSHVVTVQTRRELEETRDEYESYRKSAREKYEKLVVSHHNEIMKLKRS
jgi:septal ring factor EnvC (AmiA/AmiB activator)